MAEQRPAARLARGPRGIGLSGVTVAGTAAGVLTSMRIGASELDIAGPFELYANLFALTLTAAIGLALVPTAITHRDRR